MILVLDTCIYINLATDRALRVLIPVVENLVSRGRIHLIVPQIVLDELERHEPTVTKSLESRYRAYAKHARDLFESYLPEEDQRASAEVLIKACDVTFAAEQEEVQDAMARLMVIAKAEENHIVPSSDQLRLAASERALLKRAPFHSNRNSFADALIFESYLAVLGEPYYANLDVVLVSANTSDFSDPADHRRLHTDLLADIAAYPRARYSINFPEILNELEETRVTLEAIRQQSTFRPYVQPFEGMPQPNSPTCPDGSAHEFNDNTGACLRSRYGGLTWHVRCRRCGELYDTGDYCD